MALLRLVIAWLCMAALPLQGMAAASMLFCDEASHSTEAGSGSAHDHAGPDHRGHAPAAHGEVAAHAPAGHHAVPGSGAGQPHADHADHAKVDKAADGHSCPICASCCNLVALSEMPTLNLEVGRPAPPAAEGPARVLTRDAPGPDKPPRA